MMITFSNAPRALGVGVTERAEVDALGSAWIVCGREYRARFMSSSAFG
jgi:hypothetical protein